ncbi:glycosyltransferase involved in cell wall biosynthesis [Pontibacter aydingkolensis]|uniref:Glycosyltransferase n=1 Tax=Pontibacter aydingkolensis TaxID=1911536 RepID=A0ABS7CUZ0_9BACT|nr:glycosyltransferase [Pontibacter aydingkolensis]MBW7467665.1 glycosyltransferase [Pontibacter aydingkolensis]
MKVLQINTTVNTGSTGKIAEEVGKLLLIDGDESIVAFGREGNSSESEKIAIGTKIDFYTHILKTRLFDRHGFGSYQATNKLISSIEKLNPDMIHLHNIHGYYLNIEILFSFLKKFNKPIVWTLHDCWAFTGHCAHFEDIGCVKWKTHCNNCPKVKRYPSSWFIDNSFSNFSDKRRLFTSSNIHIVVPSRWLSNLVSESFLGLFPTTVIYNGVDTTIFNPLSDAEDTFRGYVRGRKVILGVSNVWQKSKGIDDFISLSKIISKDYVIVLIGMSPEQKGNLPENIVGISRTESPMQLAKWYTKATAFLNPTWSDNFPTTNIEALSCGTPVVTYNTGGSPEAIDHKTGFVVERGDVEGMWLAIQQIEKKGRDFYMDICRKRALKYFNKEDRYQEYINLYQSLLKEYRGE